MFLEAIGLLLLVVLFLIYRQIRSIHLSIQNAISGGPGNAIYQINSAVNALAGSDHLSGGNDTIGSVNRVATELEQLNDQISIIDDRLLNLEPRKVASVSEDF
ncbi:MAG: hypothetical protein HRU33_09565 [Rhodobacteraceae bacterium]|nr:hypothetical protein [Paracoccaceae bacterium]